MCSIISTGAKRNGENSAYQLFRKHSYGGDFSTSLHYARNDDNQKLCQNNCTDKLSIFCNFAKILEMDRFFAKLENSLKDDSIVKMTLSKPTSKNNELRNIYVKPILLKDNKMYQFTYRYERRDETKNFDSAQTMEQVRSLVPEVFQNVSLFTLAEDVTLLVSKKGKPTLMCKKVQENREQDLNHDHEKQRLIDPNQPW